MSATPQQAEVNILRNTKNKDIASFVLLVPNQIKE